MAQLQKRGITPFNLKIFRTGGRPQTQLLVYGLVGVIVTIGYALLVAGITLLVGSVLPQVVPMLWGLLVFGLALAFNPLRQTLQDRVDALFFKGEKVYQERIQSFSSELTTTVESTEILSRLRIYVESSLHPAVLHIFIFDPLADQYMATEDLTGQLTSDLRFSSNSPLVQVLGMCQDHLLFRASEAIPGLESEHARMALMNAGVFIPLPGRQRMSGWMALGSRLTGEPYTQRELRYLETLGDQAALAIERAQVVQNMEKRVREMNVLARVAQGINITLDLNDTLELIYAQTTQIIPADDFHILLKNERTGDLEEIFFVEDSERFERFENIPVQPGSLLEQEVVRQRKSILTDDHTSECQKNGILQTHSGIFAWMAVPLNAGAETIGVLSLGRRNQGMPYTSQQLNLLQAIADQVAGAVIKARLLGETERRARQMATLNEITRQLTSTLDLDPLLESILKNAVEILGTEAGSLLMVDEHTEELVFQVTIGPVAGNLLNRRMPPGAGMVGKAVRERTPIIVNQVENDPNWFSQNDHETGFITHSLMVIPLQLQDEVIGVIEVINKRDQSIFSRADQELLEAFAAQAAMAIHNARLYTQTDQALGARVEELSIMQRIDRDLNASLDTSLASRITLEWALRQSGADAGLVATMQEDRLLVVAAQGYGEELSIYTDGILPRDKFHFDDVITSGNIINLPCDPTPEEAIFPGARSQVFIPIRRESSILAVILLESQLPDLLPEETLNFLQRLSDHAAIAISNAQLYSAVQAANVAKSEFVSFVAHELKNPMTSIKGYTELLAAGAVGPISEAQGNFLGTIRANVDRMATLVTDLADVSRIEAGRLKLDFKAVSLREVVDEVIRSMKKQIDEKTQELLLAIPEDLPNLWADRTRILQIVLNLVSNAYKYTPASGRINVGAEACDNQWDASGAKRVVHFWVQDSGIGISPEDQAKIFQKFFRSEDPKTREAPGTGLGLNITRSLVEMQGGRIWFESEYRQGTVFHFTIPIAE